MGRWGPLQWQTALTSVLGSSFVAIVGCASLNFWSATPYTPVAIERFHDVEGRWEGTVKAVQGYETSWVTADVTSHESFATYTFAATGRRTPLLGAGRLQLLDGRLLTEGEGRTLTFSLAEQNGIRVLLVTGTGKDGLSYHAELKRAKE
jgi:hypothetical protein